MLQIIENQRIKPRSRKVSISTPEPAAAGSTNVFGNTTNRRNKRQWTFSEFRLPKFNFSGITNWSWYYTIGLFIGFAFFAGILLFIPLNRMWTLEARFYIPETRVDTALSDFISPFDEYYAEEAVGEHQVPEELESVEMLTYIVKPGDTLSHIAFRYDLTMDTLISYNKIADVRRIQIGSKLQIPSKPGLRYNVAAGDTLESIAAKYNTEVTAILDANNLDSTVLQTGAELFIPGARMDSFELKKILGELFIYPVRGRLTSRFGYRSDPFTGVRSFHNGIDLANRINTPINSAMAGKVVKVGVHSVYGNYIIISHPQGYQTWYAHLNRVLVRQGQYVSQGVRVGLMGSTGRSTGSHLHFSVFQHGKPINPLSLLH